jgi:hypothetical protein
MSVLKLCGGRFSSGSGGIIIRLLPISASQPILLNSLNNNSKYFIHTTTANNDLLVKQSAAADEGNNNNNNNRQLAIVPVRQASSVTKSAEGKEGRI